MREEVVFLLNGELRCVEGASAALPVARWLREKARLTGTKRVCDEGDCGACTVLVADARRPERGFRPINSCIYPVANLDGNVLVSVEGVGESDRLHPVQASMIKHQGSQCGFCTPGFVTALAGLVEDKERPSERQVKNGLTGNLCRCTGYAPILAAGTGLELGSFPSLRERYLSGAACDALLEATKEPLEVSSDSWTISFPHDLASALRARAQGARVVSGMTDLGVQRNKGHSIGRSWLSLRAVEGLRDIHVTEDRVAVGAALCLEELRAGIEDTLPDFASFLDLFASPQIKEAGTLVGNVVNASPIGDTLPFLLASNAEVEIASTRGTRTLPLSEFYTGYKTLAMEQDELITRVFLPIETGVTHRLLKVSQRKDLDISTLSAVMAWRGDTSARLQDVRVAFGGVAATPLRLREVEAWLEGKAPSAIDEAELKARVRSSIKPLSDLRGSSAFRSVVAGNLLTKWLHEVQGERQVGDAHAL